MKPLRSPNYILIVVVFIFYTSIPANAQTFRDSLGFYEQSISSPNEENDLAKAYQFFTRAYQNFKVKNDTISLIYSLFQVSRVEHKMGQYYDSETSLVEALENIDQINTSDYTKQLRKNIVNQLGILYREQKNVTKAKSLYYEALGFAETPRDSAMLYNNISNTYKDSENFEDAYSFSQKAYRLIPRMKDSLSMALILDNFGFLQYKLNKDDALDLMETALTIRLNNGLVATTYSSYKNLSDYYKTKDLTQAKVYAEKAYQVAKSINSPSYIEDALSIKIALGETNLLQDYLKLKDSLDQARQLQVNKFALLKYDVTQKEREIEQSELTTRLEKNKRQTYQLIAVFIGSLSLLIYIVLISRHKKKELQQVYATETRISKKVHDEVANDLYGLMTQIQAEPEANTDLLDAIDRIYHKTRDISKEGNIIDFETDFSESLRDLLLTYKSDDTQVITRGLNEIPWNSVSSIKKTAIYRVLQELMTNMKKHSHATIASLSFEKSQGLILIQYSDNGRGSSLRKHNGLHNAENRIKALKGSITFDSEANKGFKASIRV